MMFKQIIIVLGLCFSLTACATEPKISDFSWRYGTGSNIDQIWTTRAEFYRNGVFLGGYRMGGGGPSVSTKKIEEGRYYWAGGGGL
ncbi:hypothetical protein [Pectobacterium polaris]|uniref:hypothetical protein n=1 Tax=Pectobacterium polaris TaxID=2042057 RepID=UPI0032EDB398